MNNFRAWHCKFWILLVFVACYDRANATDLFVANAVTTDTGPVLQASDGGSSVIPLLQKAIEAQGPFSNLATRGYTSALNYANVNNAVLFDVAPNGTSAVLRIPLIGFRQDFTASNRGALYRDIENFIKRDGATEWARFLAAMNRLSPIAVNDGNPNSTTATFASATFNDFGSQNDSPVPARPGIRRKLL